MSGPLPRRLRALLTAFAVVRFGRVLVGPRGRVATVPRVVEPPRGFALQPAPRHAPARRPGRVRSLAPILLAIVVVVAGFIGWNYHQNDNQKTQMAAALVHGDPSRGPQAILRYGCAGCHEIGGVPGPKGEIGPALTDMGNRVFIAGSLENTPENLVHWIQDPKSVNPRTAMPRTGISEAEARDVAAYLLSR